MNKKRYILTIDQSTSASKILLFNKNAELLHHVSLAHQQFYPQPYFVKHDAVEIFNNIISGLNNLVSETKILKSEMTIWIPSGR